MSLSMDSSSGNCLIFYGFFDKFRAGLSQGNFLDFLKMKSDQDSKKIERYQRVILSLPEDKPFRKTDIFGAMKEELPIYIGRVAIVS